jgi:hypothetical protein
MFQILCPNCILKNEKKQMNRCLSYKNMSHDLAYSHYLQYFGWDLEGNAQKVFFKVDEYR